jgi:hypothetical protein
MQHSHRIAVSLALVAATATTITIIGARSPLSAAAAAVPNVISHTCHDPVACIQLLNAGSGVVISAEAPKNYALVGTTDQSQTGLPDATHNVGGVVGATNLT